MFLSTSSNLTPWASTEILGGAYVMRKSFLRSSVKPERGRTMHRQAKIAAAVFLFIFNPHPTKYCACLTTRGDWFSLPWRERVRVRGQNRHLHFFHLPSKERR